MDAGDPDQPKIVTIEGAKSTYADLFRLSRLIDKPCIEKNGKLLTGRDVYGNSWYPLNKSPLVHNINTQPIIITCDNYVVLVKRSHEVHHYAGCWSASIEEQMEPKGDSHDDAESLFDCAERGVKEELKGTPIRKRTRILSVGIEHSNMSASFICLVRVKERLEELRYKWPRAKDPYEADALDGLNIHNPTCLERALGNRRYHPNGKSFLVENWHPTSRMRLHALMSHLPFMEE